MYFCILLVQCLTARINLFPLQQSKKEQEAACSYLALEFAPVKSPCLARADIHSMCMTAPGKAQVSKESKTGNLVIDESLMAHWFSRKTIQRDKTFQIKVQRVFRYL